MQNFKNTDRESSVSINNINNKTNNNYNEHITSNTTFAPFGAEKVVSIETSSPLASASQKNDFVKLEEEVVRAREIRDRAHQKKHADYAHEQAERRKKMQFAKERDAKYLIEHSDEVFRMEATMHLKHNKINIDVLQYAGAKFAKYISQLQCSRPRDLTANVAPKHRDWWGYDVAIEAMKRGCYAGKIRLRQTTGTQTKIAPKILPKTVTILDGRSLRIIIGDAEYSIYLEDFDNEFYGAKGVYQREEDCIEL